MRTFHSCCFGIPFSTFIPLLWVLQAGSECAPSGGDQQDQGQGSQVLQCGQCWGVQDNYEPGRYKSHNQMIDHHTTNSRYTVRMSSSFAGVWLWCDHPSLQHKNWALDCTILICQGIWVSMELVNQAKPFPCSAESWKSSLGLFHMFRLQILMSKGNILAYKQPSYNISVHFFTYYNPCMCCQHGSTAFDCCKYANCWYSLVLSDW